VSIKSKKGHFQTHRYCHYIWCGNAFRFFNRYCSARRPLGYYFLSLFKSVCIYFQTLMIAFFLVVDLMALISCLWYGLLDSKILVLSAKMIFHLGVGIWIGNYLFGRLLNEKKIGCLSIKSPIKFSLSTCL
jgi:hypothetical protein